MSDFTPTVETLGDEALTSSIIDRSVTEILDNVLTIIGNYSFRLCTKLEHVKFENVTVVGQAAFWACQALTIADFYKCVSLYTNAFYGCTALTALILRDTEAVSSFSSSFSNSAISSGTGYIYVPAALVDTYKADSAWSAYADQIRAIEDYPEVCDPYTWTAVFKNIDNGTYASVYKVGDLVPLDLGSEGLVNMQIVAFDTEDLADGSGKAPITWISKELLATAHRMNPNLVTNEDGTYQEGTGAIGGWEKSELRAYMKETVKPLIPENVRNRIATVTKTQKAYDTSGTSVTQTTQEDVYIPSNSETTYSVLNSASKRKKTSILGGSGAVWWLRYAHNKEKFRHVDYLGNANDYQYSSASSSIGIALTFCTGASIT